MKERDFSCMDHFAQNLLYKILPKSWWKVPGMRERVQLDLSRVLVELSIQGSSVEQARLRVERTVREAVAWERKNLEDHCSAQVERIPTEDPGVDAYVVTLPEGTPCTTLTLEGAAAMYKIDLKALRSWVRGSDLPAYHVVEWTFEPEGGSEAPVYTSAMDLYAFVDLQNLLKRGGRLT